MQISLSFHIIGLVLWLGSLMMLTRFATTLAVADANSNLLNMIQRMWKFMGLSGLAMALLSGLHQFGSKGAAFYMSQGWFHTKLTLVIILFVISILFHLELKKVAAGGLAKKSKLMAMHGITGLCLIIIVFITMLGRV